MTTLAPIDQCRGTAREHGRPFYLAALFLPPKARETAFATIAFNHELSRIATVVSEPLLGEIRLQWWRDAVIAPTPADHPVIQALAAAKVDRAALRAMINARAADVYPEPCADLVALEAYAAATTGALLEFWQDGSAARTAARDLGTAWGLMAIIRAAPRHTARGKTFIPADTAPPQVLDRAAHFLHRAEQQAKTLPSTARRGLRLAILARRELLHMKKHRDQDPLPERFDRLDALHLALGG